MNERTTATRLGGILGVHERQVQRICDAAGLEPIKGQGYETEEAVRAVVQHFKTASEAISAEAEKDKAAKLRAERETAEMTAAERKGLLVPAAAVEIFWADAMIQAVDAVKRQPITQAHKDGLIADLRKIKVTPKKADE